MRFQYVIPIFILILFLASCTGVTQKETSGGVTFIGGINGLVFSFIEESPPDIVYDNGQHTFSIGVKVKNNGEFDVPPNSLRIKVKGINPLDFSLNTVTKTNNEVIFGKKKYPDGSIVPGYEIPIVFENLKYTKQVLGDMPFPIIVEGCYLYRTVGIARICITDNLLKKEEKDVCTVRGEKEVANSGAPIQITWLREDPAGQNQLQVQFKIEHVGKGYIFAPECSSSSCRFKGENCDKDEISSKVKNRVYVIVDQEGQWSRVSCIGLNGKQGYVDLFEDENTGNEFAMITCKLTLSNNEKGNYLKPLSISVYYQYRDEISKEIMVRHIETGTGTV